MDIDDLIFRPDLLAAGFNDEELRARRRRGELERVRRGAYTCLPDARGATRHALLVAAAVRELSPDAVVCGVSAAVLHGLPLWNVRLDRVHVSRPRRSGGRRGRLVHVHATPLDADEVVLVGSTAVTSVARTVVDVARRVPFEHAVVLADAARHRHLVTDGELARALLRAAHKVGAPAARRAVAFSAAGGASVGESRSRVALHRAGVPAPVLQWPVRSPSGQVVGRVDFGWPALGTVGEFDGLSKYGRGLRPGQTPADAVVAEKLREDRLRDEGVRVVRWTWSDLDTFGTVRARLERAFHGR